MRLEAMIFRTCQNGSSCFKLYTVPTKSKTNVFITLTFKFIHIFQSYLADSCSN